MKKVVLSSVVALSLFALAVPAFAADEATNAARQGDPEYYLQTEFTNADKANEYLAGHSGEIGAEAAQDPAVVAAKKELDAVEGGSHLYGEKKAAYESAYNDAFNTVRNKYVKQFQGTYNNATEQEGKTYIKGETPEKANERYLKRVGAANNQPGSKAADKGTNPASAAEAKASEAKAANGAKAGQKAAGKALPKTSAVK
mgnify:FL=1